jgi:hypothetical protein
MMKASDAETGTEAGLAGWTWGEQTHPRLNPATPHE